MGRKKVLSFASIVWFQDESGRSKCELILLFEKKKKSCLMWCGTRSWLHVLLVVVLMLSGFDHMKKEQYSDVQNEKQASGHWSELLGLFGTGMTSVSAARPPPPTSPPPKHLKRKSNADKLKDSVLMATASYESLQMSHPPFAHTWRQS